MPFRKFLIAAAALAAGIAASASAQTVVTLPSAASVTGVSPFYSDVRAFNSSFTGGLQVTATYRCYIGTCPASPPQTTFTLNPRESKALDDICNLTFGAPNTGGAVEFASNGGAGQLVVTSRLYATQPTPTVGMYVAGLPSSGALELAVLTSIRNGGTGLGFRTNVGVYNPGSTAVEVTWEIRDNTTVVGNFVRRTVGPRSGVQVNQIFREAGADSTATQNGVISVSSTGPVFSYASVLDNNTQDPYYVVGAAGQPTP